MDSALSFSVITPVYNRPDVICRCIESVDRAIIHAKSVLPFDIMVEHIVVDDGSDDDTLDRIKAYSMPHLKAIAMPGNKGTNAARNHAIAHASGQYCIFLDSDDYFLPSAIETIASSIAASPAYSHYLFICSDIKEGYEANGMLHNRESTVVDYVDFLAGRVHGDFVHVPATCLAKRHPFDEELRAYEHIVMLQYYKDAGKILFTNKVTTTIERGRADATTRVSIRFDKRNISQKASAIAKQLDIFGDEYDRHGLHGIRQYLQLDLADNLLLLGHHTQAAAMLRSLPALGLKHKMLSAIAYLHLGGFYRMVLTAYLKHKYN